MAKKNKYSTFVSNSKELTKKKRTETRQNSANEYQGGVMKTGRNSTDQAYIRGDIRQVSKNKVFGHKKSLENGEGGNLKKEAIRNPKKYTVERNHVKDKKKKYNWIDSTDTTTEGFSNRLNTFKADGIAIAKSNQRANQPIRNLGQYGAGLLKDVVVDPAMDFVRGVDRIESAVTGGLWGVADHLTSGAKALTDPSATFKDYRTKDVIKNNVKASLDESDRTGWGRSMSETFKEMEQRDFEKEVAFHRRRGNDVVADQMEKDRANTNKNEREFVSNIAGLGADILNPVNVGTVATSVFKKLGKGVANSFDEMAKGTADLSTGFVPKELTNFKGKQKPPTKATGASDEVFFSGKAIDDIENTKLDRVLNKGYKDAVGKPEPIVKTGNQVVDDFVSTLKQPKETNIDVPKTKEELKVELSSFSGRQKMFNSINPIKLKDETGELNFLMKDILGYKSKLGKNDNKGKGLLNTKIKKLPKGKREEFINALNDNLFDGNPVIHKNASYGYIRELAEKYTKNTPEQFYNDVIPKISSSLTDPSHYDKGRFLKEHGGIGEYQKYVDETNRLIEHSNTLKPGSIEFSNVQKDILERQDKIRKRNKLASEIYSLEPERFYKEYSGDFSNNPLGIKDSEWKHNNQIKDLVDNGMLDDNAKRIDTNVQETFVSSPQESQMENGSYINKQIWDIVAGNVGGGKRVSYHKGSIKDLDTQINTLSKDLEEAFSNFDFDKMGEINKSIEELKIDKKSKQKLIKEMGKEFENLKSLVSDDAISQQSVIDDLLGDIYEKFPHLKTNGDKPKVTPKAKQKKIFDNLKPLEGMDKSSVSIARRIAEQHGVKEPVKFKFGNEINPTRYRDNKVEIQKLAELRVLQSTTKGATGKVMDDALSLLIKEHMDNMKTSLPPQEYAKLQNGVKQYVNDMKKAYSTYSSGKNKYMQNPLEKIGDKKFYTSKMDEEGAILDKLAESKALDMKYDDAINSQNVTTSIESISGSTPQVIPGDNKSLSANLQLLASKFVDDVDEIPVKDIDGQASFDFGKLVNNEYVPNQINESPLNNVGKANVDPDTQINMLGYITGGELGVDKKPFLSQKKKKVKTNELPKPEFGGKYYDDSEKLASIDDRLASRLTPERMSEVLGEDISDVLKQADEPSKYANPNRIPRGSSSSIDELSETTNQMNKVSDEVAMDVEELAKEGVDATKQPPKEKPKDMSTGLYKRWLNTWKKGVTAYNPGWHIQNLFQNKGQNYLALGADAFMPQTDAKKILKAMNGKSTGEMINLGKNGKMSTTELAELADKLGVAEGLSDNVINSKGLFPKLETKVDNSGLNKWLSKSENTARLNHWVRQMQNGMNPDEALKSVNKYLFDYSDKGGKANEFIGDYVDPFWTFHRNNARLMVESAYNNPSEFGKVQRGLRNLNADINPEQQQKEESMYRDYQQPGASFYDPVNDGQYNFLYDQNMLPDFKGAIPGDQEEFENKLNPLARIALQHSRKEGNFGNKIVEAGQEAGWGEITPVERGWEVFKDLNPVLPQVLNTLDKTHNRQKKANDGKVSQETTDKQILNDWLQYLTGQKANWYRNI